MINEYLTNIQLYFTETPRHWCPHSEKYTGADSLITALRNGWALSRLVYREDVYHGGSRHTAVYYFELKRDTAMVTMPIICTPFIVRFIAHLNLKVLHEAETGSRIYETAEEPVVRIGA
jgi:hypothetical protein